VNQLRLVHVATGEELHLSDGSFLLRISLDEHGTVLRCLVRHLASGREGYLQGGGNLRAFVKAYLLSSGGTAPAPGQTAPTPEESQEATGDTSGEDTST
jgi:hypothetical protein